MLTDADCNDTTASSTVGGRFLELSPIFSCTPLHFEERADCLTDATTTSTNREFIERFQRLKALYNLIKEKRERANTHVQINTHI